MDPRLEMAKLARDVLLEFIQPVQLLTLESDSGTGEVKGRFRSGPLLFDYSIGKTVKYSPLGGSSKAAARAGQRDQQAAVAAPTGRGDSGALQQLPAAGPVEDVARDQWVRRGVAYLAALRGQDETRVDAYLAAEVRMDGPGQKRCQVGYQCGGTCIARSKVCVMEVQGRSQAAVRRLGELASPASGGDTGEDPGDAKHRGLKAERVALGQQLLSRLEQKRSDGEGTLMQNPDKAAMKLIEEVREKREAIDRQLNRLEGRPADEKRWYEDEDEVGLTKFMEPEGQSKSPLGPGREAYERRLIDKYLSNGAEGDQSIFMAGGPASGKTSLLNSKFADSSGQVNGYVTIDPDSIKSALPEMQVGIALGIKAAAAISHEQSSRIAKELLKQAKSKGLNFIMDGTGANTSKYVREMEDARSKGYKVDLLMQHVEEKVGVERAVGRADRIGRFVPRAFIEHAYKVLPNSWEALSSAADRATLNDSEQNIELAAVISGRTVANSGATYRQYMRRYPQK
jgi:predicted ABC-type ATPase